MKRLLWFAAKKLKALMVYWHQRWGERSFLILLSIIIGVLAAMAAALLHNIVAWLDMGANFLREHPEYYCVLALLPFTGVMLSYFSQRLLGGAFYSKSLSPLMLNLSRGRSSLPVRDTVTHIISSGLSVGLGGSAGLEMPSVLTGAAVGSNVGRAFGLSKNKKPLLLGCGSAAAIASIFNSPIAGVLFVAELFFPSITVSAMVPLILSSAVSSVVSKMLFADKRFFLADHQPWQSEAVPFYLILGILSALIGIYMIKSSTSLGHWLHVRFRNSLKRALFGGTMLSLLIVLMPPLYGQGYAYIEALFHMESIDKALNMSLPGNFWWPSNIWLLLGVTTVILLFKVIATVMTVEGGGDGGIFAPSLMVGAMTGFTFAQAVNQLGLFQLYVGNFVAVGMCGVFTAVLRTPLTGIFLVAELTGGYELLVPLMLVSCISYAVAKYIEPYSVYTKSLAESNQLDKDQDQTLMHRVLVRGNIDKSYHALSVNDSFKRLTHLIAATPDNQFPVLDEEKKLIGMVKLEKVRLIMLEQDVYDCLLVFDVMESPEYVLHPDDDLAKASGWFDEAKFTELPVCSKQGVFMGFVTKSSLFNRYRELVKHQEGL